MNKKLIISAMAILLFSGCTWVHVSPEAENVRVVKASDVEDCQKLGETSASLLAKIAGMNRSKKKVATELTTLGRNSASEMGGDTIVSISEIKNGEQTFGVYRCFSPGKNGE